MDSWFYLIFLKKYASVIFSSFCYSSTSLSVKDSDQVGVHFSENNRLHLRKGVRYGMQISHMEKEEKRR